MIEQAKRILEIVKRRKRLALIGRGEMQYSEYDEIEKLVRKIEKSKREVRA
jgi:hypothetical protein